MRNNRLLVWTAVGTAVFALALMQDAVAGTCAERTTYLTFSRPVQLPGVALSAGTYVFELADPAAAPSVVRVLSRDRRTTYFMSFTKTAERPRGMRLEASVSIGESVAGFVPPITVWWPNGETTGRQFIYPGR
jgi:hypothetical protein